MERKILKAMVKKKRHHYIPRFYLDGFVDPHNEPYIWIYEKGNSDVRKASAENVAVEKHYYSFITPSGDRDSETFENALAKVEEKVAPILEKIKNREHLDDEERGGFASFLALTMTRVPNYRTDIEKSTGELIKKISMKMASNAAGFESMMGKMEKETGNKIEMPVEELRKFMLNGEYDVKVDSQFSLFMIGLAEELAPVFFEMSWAFLEATNDYKFVTCDNPLFYYDPTHDPKSLFGVGLLNKNIEVTFPISRDLIFLGTWGKLQGYKKLNNNIVKKFTHRTIISALRFVFASQNSEQLNKIVQKYKGSSPRMIIE